jgi:hypothetical protein
MPHHAAHADLPLRKAEDEVVLALELERVSDGEQAAVEAQIEDAKLDFLSKLGGLAEENPGLFAPLLMQARPDEIPHALAELRGKSLETDAGPVQVGLDLRAVDHARANRKRGFTERELEGEERVVLEKTGALEQSPRRTHVHDPHVAPVLSESFHTSAQRETRGAARGVHGIFHCNTCPGGGLSRVRISR